MPFFNSEKTDFESEVYYFVKRQPFKGTESNIGINFIPVTVFNYINILHVKAITTSEHCRSISG
jgi:hypothetical protein